jgi:hypothetical protein
LNTYAAQKMIIFVGTLKWVYGATPQIEAQESDPPMVSASFWLARVYRHKMC